MIRISVFQYLSFSQMMINALNCVDIWWATSMKLSCPITLMLNDNLKNEDSTTSTEICMDSRREALDLFVVNFTEFSEEY